MEPGFAAKYHPLTSRPFLNGDTYAEYAPCRQLSPYIACFCGIADSPALIKQKPSDQGVTTFAVRFHFWAVRLFLDIDIRELYNQVIGFDWIDPKAAREFEALFPMASTTERIGWMETYLLKRLMEPTARDRCNACFCRI